MSRHSVAIIGARIWPWRPYELTALRLLTSTDAIGEIAKATGRDIRYEPVSTEEHAAAAREQGVPAEVIDLLTYLFSEVLDGRNAPT